MFSLFEHFSVAVSAVSGALAGRGRRVDLFGVLVLALVTAFGGGTIRDLCLGAVPVFWISNAGLLLTALTAGGLTFAIASRRELPMRLLEISDAFGLAFFAVLGAQKALTYHSSWAAAIALGTATGAAGGLLRDVLLNEVPMVFRREIRLYATAAAVGCAVLVAVRQWTPDIPEFPALMLGAAAALTLRLAAIRWKLALPEFEDRRGGKS